MLLQASSGLLRWGWRTRVWRKNVRIKHGSARKRGEVKPARSAGARKKNKNFEKESGFKGGSPWGKDVGGGIAL